MRRYIIRSIERGVEPLFWNNDLGWVEFALATIFTEEERLTLRLPMGASRWVGML